MLAQTLILIYKNFLIFDIFVFFFLNSFCSFFNIISKFLSGLIRLIKLILNNLSFLINIFIELEFLIQCCDSWLQVIMIQSLLVLLNCNLGWWNHWFLRWGDSLVIWCLVHLGSGLTLATLRSYNRLNLVSR